MSSVLSNRGLPNKERELVVLLQELIGVVLEKMARPLERGTVQDEKIIDSIEHPKV